MDTPPPSAAREEMSAAVSEGIHGLLVRVTRENVLTAAHAVASEAQLLHDKIGKTRGACVIRPPGQDPVSLDVTPQLNARVSAHLDGLLAYADALGRGSEQLRAAARRYGYTEEEIAGSFARYQRDNPPPSSASPS